MNCGFTCSRTLQGRPGWEWVRWLPHCRPGPGGGCVAQLGNDAESIAARIAELLAIVSARQRMIRDGYLGVGSGPGIVVVLDGSRRLRSLPGVGQLLGEGPQVGVFVICLDDGERLLPPECRTVAAFGRDGLQVQRTMADTVRSVAATTSTPAGAPGWPGPWRRSGTPATTGADGRAREQGLSGRLRRLLRLLRRRCGLPRSGGRPSGRPEPEPKAVPVPVPVSRPAGAAAGRWQREGPVVDDAFHHDRRRDPQDARQAGQLVIS